MAEDTEKIKNDLILLLSQYEFGSFLLGIIGDDQRKDIKKEIGSAIENHFKIAIDHIYPDILAKVDLETGQIHLDIKPLFIYGRYQKLQRNISQTRLCAKYQSVEGLIGEIVLKQTKGSKAILHGAGREDIDVLMLGNGRPFVIEIKEPQIRNLDLIKLEQEINKKQKNKINVAQLRFSDAQEIALLKDAGLEKTYRVLVQGQQNFDKLKLFEAVQTLNGATIIQRTPNRVMGHRSDLMRKRQIIFFKTQEMKGNSAEFSIKTQSGTYIKELINGDKGQTNPSLTSLLGQQCQVKELDVIEIGKGFLAP